MGMGQLGRKKLVSHFVANRLSLSKNGDDLFGGKHLKNGVLAFFTQILTFQTYPCTPEPQPLRFMDKERSEKEIPADARMVGI